MQELTKIRLWDGRMVGVAYRKERTPSLFRIEGLLTITAEQMADIELLFNCKAEASISALMNNGVRSDYPHLVVWLIGATHKNVTEAIKKLREAAQ
jgi:hypothetical protein